MNHDICASTFHNLQRIDTPFMNERQLSYLHSAFPVPRFLSWLVSTFIFRIQVWQVCSVQFLMIWYDIIHILGLCVSIDLIRQVFLWLVFYIHHWWGWESGDIPHKNPYKKHFGDYDLLICKALKIWMILYIRSQVSDHQTEENRLVTIGYEI